MNKLKILISSVVVLMLSAFTFGVIDYVKASEKGTFKTLYKEVSEPNPPAPKEIDIDDFSRGKIEKPSIENKKTDSKKEILSKKNNSIDVKKSIATAPKKNAQKLKKVNKLSLKSFSRGKIEEYTPPIITEAVDSISTKN